MAVLFNSGSKHCATCTYWNGRREIVSGGQSVRSIPNDKGICNNPKSSFKGKSTLADYGSCLKYEKWQVLK